MKKRIIAFGLALTVLFCSLGFAKRASAAATGTIVAIASIGSLAFSVFMLITSGEAERIADDVYNWIEYTAKPGAEELFVGDGSDLAIGYNQIFQTMKGWFETGELEVVDGQVKLTYSQFLELYGQSLTVMSKPNLDFQTGFNCVFLNCDLNRTFTLQEVPKINEYLSTANGQAIAPVYYNDERIIFPDSFVMLNCHYDGNGNNRVYSVDSSFRLNFINGCSFNGLDIYYSECKPYCVTNLNQVSLFVFFMGSYHEYATLVNYCFVYENGSITRVPVSDVDVSGLNSGLVITSGAYGEFLNSIRGYSSTPIPPANLDDLSSTIPTQYNPSLTFPVNPDSSIPLSNQIIVSNVPGIADAPLSDYQADFDTDIDIPSIIVDKFPFCIPYDFIRFLGILCAEPQAPVFRIPISTHPDNLEQWEGNQTVGEYLNPDNPMFEIDEEIVIDLSVIPLVQPICYTCFIVGFIFLLLHITPKMIQH